MKRGFGNTTAKKLLQIVIYNTPKLPTPIGNKLHNNKVLKFDIYSDINLFISFCFILDVFVFHPQHFVVVNCIKRFPSTFSREQK